MKKINETFEIFFSRNVDVRPKLISGENKIVGLAFTDKQMTPIINQS